MTKNIEKYEISPEQMTSKIKISNLEFKTTKDLKPFEEILGQERATQAINFGVNMKIKGYNIYVCGYTGTGRNSYIKKVTQSYAKENFDKNKLKDYVYVYNFKDEYSPISISFPAGKGKEFQKDMEEMHKAVRKNLIKDFTTVKYANESMKFSIDYENKVEGIIDRLNEKAMKKRVIFHVGEDGLVSMPLNKDYSIPTEEDIENFTDEDFVKFKTASNKLHKELTKAMDEMRKAEEEYNLLIENYDKKLALNTLEIIFKRYFGDCKDEKILSYLFDMKEDIIKNLDKFKQVNSKNKVIFTAMKVNKAFFDRYKVNLFIDNSQKDTLPVIEETNPTYYNLNGYLEYKNRQGSFITSFLDIKAGALQKANGGFLVININDLLKNPYSWDCIKRTLKTRTATIDSLSEYNNYILTTSLKPEKMEIDVKVIFIGDYETYELLYDFDEDFQKLFKILSEFDIEMDNTKANQEKFARSLKTHCDKKDIKPLTRDAVFEMIRYSNRLAEDKNKLSSRYNKIMELVYEANYLSESKNKNISQKDILKALEFKKFRNNRYQEKLYEMYKDGTLLIDIEGEKVGQINGLVVISEGEYSFGSPSKITASTYIGKEGIINIEREVKNTGASHDKGIMILSGYLGERYGKDKSLSFTSSITFEQNYGYIDGDSASSTELYLLFSSIADLPIKQYIAVTGSVSQKGEIQPIGGVNEKIEGFFDICTANGLNSKQGVIIPKLNVQNLILKQEVIDACEKGLFHIYAVSTVDEGLEILTGLNKKQIDEKMNKVLQEYTDYFEGEEEE
ncbi:AAA domain protein [Peptostreptococcaceae bacterium AS15]|jgi:peptidase S16 lon domain protein|nr:AAA domain protein [Peptostreptococcaceae bacterium AS15]